MTDYSYTDNVIGKIEKTAVVSNYQAVTSYTAAKYDILVRRTGVTDEGDNYAERSAWSLSGLTDANTASLTLGRQALYLRITGTTDADVKLYTAASGVGEVASGTLTTRTTGDTVTLSESNSSGISGTVVLADSCTNTTDAVLYLEDYHDRYDHDVDSSSDNIIGIYFPYDSDTTTIKSVIQEADNVVLARLGKDNVDGEFGLSTLRKNLRKNNIITI